MKLGSTLAAVATLVGVCAAVDLDPIVIKVGRVVTLNGKTLPF